MSSSTITSSPSDLVERGKQAASVAAVERHVTCDGMAVGIGSGSTVVYAVRRLGELARERGWNHIACVPTSFQSIQLITAEKSLVLSDLSRHPALDVAIDGADEVDPELNCIKGAGAAHLQEKIVASCAPGHFVLVCDERKKSARLGSVWKKGVPIEVLPIAHVPVSLAITRLGGKPQLRMAVAKAGPVVTDNGNFVIDADFGEIADANELNASLSAIPGVVETGLFLNMAVECYIGKSDGSVEVMTAKPSASPRKREKKEQ